MFKFIFFIVLNFLMSVFSTTTVNAQESEKIVTIVNPVRISSYNKTPEKSLKAQYSIIKEYDLLATWLLTYDALENPEIIKEIGNMDNNQEFGVFLEITKNFADSQKIPYDNGGSWHHAKGVFLSGYTQEERKIFIDSVFEKFKNTFGEYPKSIGSWWTDGYSLSYIEEKYDIKSNLVCSDQFSTDGYQIWGQPWQSAYYPSKFHPATPAKDKDLALGIVNIQWASRDPLGGYTSSLYSTQDYVITGNGLDIEYFEKLLDTYLFGKNKLNQIVVGLESDLGWDGYSGEYKKQIQVVKDFKNKGVEVKTMSQFADIFENTFFGKSTNTCIETDDLLGKEYKSYWCTTPFYRIFYVKNLVSDEIEIKDLRIYDQNLLDPYFLMPNKENNLSINIPFVIDSVQNPENSWKLDNGTQIIVGEKDIKIIGRRIKVPDFVKNNPLLKIKKSIDGVKIGFSEYKFDTYLGDIRKSYSLEAIHFFKTKSFPLKLLTGKGWENFKKIKYIVSKDEVYALLFLKSLPKGKVLVVNKECLQCSWFGDYRPMVFSNIRGYVKDYSKKEIVYNSLIFETNDRGLAKKEFEKTKAKYIYLVKYFDYAEHIPFSPGDLGVEKIFNNANVEIWRVK